jgi:hypothetical protein
MNDQFNIGNRSVFYLLFFIIALITFYPLLFTGFATADDLHYFMVSRRGLVWEDTALFAKVAGRFYFYLVKPMYNMAYLIDNIVVIKAFHFVPLVLCFLYFARIIRKLTNSTNLSWLFLLLFLATMQISRHTSLFVAYPFYFTFSFLLLLMAFDLLLRFYTHNKKRDLWLSAFLFFLGLLFYETYIFFILFVMLAAVWQYSEKPMQLNDRIRRLLRELLPYLLFGFLYLAVYFTYRYFYPSHYDGTSFAKSGISFASFFKVLWKLSLTSFPLMVYENSHHVFWEKSELLNGYSPVLLNLILSAKIEWLAKGILVAFAGFYLMKYLPVLTWKRIWSLTIVAILLIFMPHVPLAITEKYIFYVSEGGMIGYVTTFFSFFGTLLFITMMLAILMKIFDFSRMMKTAAISVFIFGLFLCSVITDFSNYTIAKDIRSANLRFHAMDELVKTDVFKTIPANTPFFAKTMWDSPSISAPNITEQDFNWYEYLEYKTGNIYPVGRDTKVFLEHIRYRKETPWFLGMRQAAKSEEICLVMAPLENMNSTDSVVSEFSGKATVLYYSSYKAFTVSFKVTGDGQAGMTPIQINHIKDEVPVNKTVEITIFNTKKGNPATIFTIQFPGIDLNSIIISNMVRMENKIFYL